MDISTHTLTWSVTHCFHPLYLAAAISTHTLTWSVTGEKLWEFVAGINFNSHAHVERDLRKSIKLGKNAISTHTLTWSVTISCGVIMYKILISTHTLTWSVTTAETAIREELEISTHTLTWSVTCHFSTSFVRESFQLTRSRGA